MVVMKGIKSPNGPFEKSARKTYTGKSRLFRLMFSPLYIW